MHEGGILSVTGSEDGYGVVGVIGVEGCDD